MKRPKSKSYNGLNSLFKPYIIHRFAIFGLFKPVTFRPLIFPGFDLIAENQKAEKNKGRKVHKVTKNMAVKIIN